MGCHIIHQQPRFFVGQVAEPSVPHVQAHFIDVALPGVTATPASEHLSNGMAGNTACREDFLAGALREGLRFCLLFRYPPGPRRWQHGCLWVGQRQIQLRSSSLRHLHRSRPITLKTVAHSLQGVGSGWKFVGRVTPLVLADDHKGESALCIFQFYKSTGKRLAGGILDDTLHDTAVNPATVRWAHRAAVPEQDSCDENDYGWPEHHLCFLPLVIQKKLSLKDKPTGS